MLIVTSILMGAPIRSCFLVVFLLSGYLEAMDPFLHPANPMFATERRWVLHFSAHDPCSRWGFWFTLTDDEKARATDDCEQAYDGFILLTDEEQASCRNAQEPKCLSGFGCNQLEYKCTFLCRTEVEEWRRQEGGAKRLEKVIRRVLRPKPLRTIAATVVEPRGIPAGSEPEVYSRGPSRSQKRTYSRNQR